MKLNSVTPVMGGGIIVRAYEVTHERVSCVTSMNASTGTHPVCMRGSLHRCGTEPRDFHWWTVLVETPREAAPSFTRSQSRAVVASDILSPYNDAMSETQGQFVKRLEKGRVLQFVSMKPDDGTEAAFNRRAWQMILNYQGTTGMSDEQMAVFLSWTYGDVTETNYASYKRVDRARFPAHLIWRFCRRTGYALDGVPAVGAQSPKTRRHRLMDLAQDSRRERKKNENYSAS